MNPTDLATRYRLLNRSFKKTMIYHIGIDAGFFTEYTYMLHAMLYCLQHKIQFKLYSDDANFGWEKGWEDCFAPFCEQVHEPLHRTYNTHRLPSWQALMKDKKRSKTKLLKWKLKVTCKNIIGKALAFFTYGKPVLLNFQVTFNPRQHFHIPALGIDGDYLHAFQKLTEITWKLNDTTAQECRQFAADLKLPPPYAGCQIRGGDKITETNLLPPEHYIRLIKEKTTIRDVFVLTDDYRLFEQVQTLAPDIHWYTLCSPNEQGYVNSTFTQTTKELKQRQMARFLCSIQLLMDASVFIGSITTGPSLFLLKNFYPDIHPADCLLKDFPQASVLPIPGRGRVATEFMQGNSHKKYTAEELDLLHAELYDILGETIRVCEKHHIPYFVIGGTAIGALYDQGILPWDDDIDIGMTRENYNKFLEVAPQELGPSYFLSWIETDPHTPYYYAKVKKNNTLFVEEMFKNVPMHPGIFVDIFPFDRLPDNKLLRQIQSGVLGFLKCCLMGKEIWMWKHFGKCEIENPTNRGAFSCLLNRIVDSLFSKKTIYRMLVSVQSCFNSRRTRYYNNVMATADHVTVESIRHLQTVKFGPLTVTAPNELETFLRYNYPTLHRYTKEEQEQVNNHYPAALSFSTTLKQER